MSSIPFDLCTMEMAEKKSITPQSPSEISSLYPAKGWALTGLAFEKNSRNSQKNSYPKPFQDEESGLYGYEDKEGYLEINPKFSKAENFHSPIKNHAYVRLTSSTSLKNNQGVGNKNNSWHIINKRGKVLYTSFSLKNSHDIFHKGLSRIINPHGKIGFINTKGKIAIPITYDYAGPFLLNIDLAPAYKASSFEKNNSPLEKKFPDLSDKKSLPHKKGSWGFINRNGSVVIPFIFDNISIALLPQQIFKNLNKEGPHEPWGDKEKKIWTFIEKNKSSYAPVLIVWKEENAFFLWVKKEKKLYSVDIQPVPKKIVLKKTNKSGQCVIINEKT